MIQSSDELDVLVIGGGPAGLATALRLHQYRLKVQVVTKRKQPRELVGDHLSVETSRVLHQLGCWNKFLDAGHLKSSGTRSIWGSNRIEFSDAISRPSGGGWYVDRLRFERMIEDQVNEQGIEMYNGTLIDVTSDSKGWIVQTDKAIRHVRMVIEASGKTSAFARKLGISRIREDRQIAHCTVYRSEKPAEFFAMIEAMESGWWYSSCLPGGLLSVILVTDADAASPWLLHKSSEWVEDTLSATVHTSARIRRHCGGARKIVSQNIVHLSSGRLEVTAGKDWIAVGDSAICYDPIAAHGISQALVTGRDAADAAADALSGDMNRLSQYTKRLDYSYTYYTNQRKRLYSVENRWPRSVYWMNRQRTK
ncbi:NAD(P)/FAD-dependent oxidoreductase [Paenibacillus polymyxa]|uniref:NAD(P)/FAD-dependent oxidoreductase n=1 Tax=Paenibacillus polymyxa TaxID=1406 RepID=UPI001BECC85C|nr:NAD(P)/FAD-dependent oxidoreductase [Paenibacillus polymyxa]MBT2286072.1 NAD(P)/FAD-dependent oxidoreductase [Paenibacillus polymyxa]